MSATSPDVRRGLPTGEALQQNIRSRRRTGTIWRRLFLASLVLALLALGALLYKVIDDAFGYVALEYRTPPAEILGGRELEQVTEAELIAILEQNLSAGRFRNLNRELPFEQRSKEGLWTVVLEDVARQRVEHSWSLTDSLLRKRMIDQQMAEDYPDATLEFRSWINYAFLTTPMSSKPEFTGVRTAMLGSIYMILITIIVALPLGIGAAIYLEEYAGR